MVFDFETFIINESSIKDAKKNIRGVLKRKQRRLFKELLRKRIVTFKFRKRDGSIRTARGTLYPTYLPRLRGGSPRPEHQMVYFDLDKDAWRSFRSFTFIKIIGVSTIPSSSTGTSSKSSKTSKSSKPIHKSKPVVTTHTSTHHKHIEDDDEEDVEMKPIKHSSSDEHHSSSDEKEVKKKVEGDEHSSKHHDEHEGDDVSKKTFKAGEKMSEEELERRSSDFRKGSRKNKHTHEANDKFRKEHKEHKEESHHSDEHKEHKEHKEKEEDE